MNGVKRFALGVAAVLSLCAFAPSLALATDYCVGHPACVSGGGVDKPSVESALTAAEADTALDRVLIGPGTFTAPNGGYDAPANPVQVIGAAAGATTLTAPKNTADVLFLGDGGSSVSDLKVLIPQNTDKLTKVGLRLPSGGIAERISVAADPALSTVVIGVHVAAGAVLADSVIELPTADSANTLGVQANPGGSVRDTRISARAGIATHGSNIQLERNRLTITTGVGIRVLDSNVNIDATSTLIRLIGNSAGVEADTANNTDAGITARNLTIVGDGTASSAGAVALSNTAHTASVTLDSSIVRGVGHSLRRGSTAGTAELTVRYSDYNPANVLEDGVGSITVGEGNINADPQFAGALDFHLSGGSPAIDAGNLASFADTLDADEQLRVTDGNGDSVARRDMGAFEHPTASAPPPSPPPSDPPPSDPPPSGPPPNGPPPSDPPPTGDPATTPSTTQPAPTTPSTGTADTVSPAISGLVASPSRFTVGRPGTAVSARVARGTRFRFRLSEDASVRIKILRRVPGTRNRFRRVGALRRHLTSGSRSVGFSGRLGKKTLRAGRYRAVVTAIDASGNRSTPARVSFRIVRG
jgi:hypothetical protein